MLTERASSGPFFFSRELGIIHKVSCEVVRTAY